MTGLAERVHAQAAADRARIEAMPIPPGIFALLQEAAAECPDHPVAEFFDAGETVTYAGLVQRALRRAATFRAVGVGPGTPVVLGLPNCTEWLVCWMALMALGALMVPVNTRSTARELDFLVEDSGARHAVLDETLAAALGARRMDAVFVRGALADDLPPLAPAALPPLTAGHLANIQFTSGSTGRPKGCLLTHRYWIILGLATGEIYLPKPTRLLIHKPLYYMDGQAFFMVALVCRATVCFPDRPSASKYVDWLRTHRIDFCCFFPELVFKQAPGSGEGLALLRACSAGWNGQNRVAAQHLYGCPFFEMFGMTEIGAALYVPDSGVDLAAEATCGVPLPYQSCKVVRADGTEAAPDEVGELWVKGPALFSGYHNRKEANEESIRDGWFRTGDLFCRDARGFFAYSGRMKDMIRRSGENIAAQEVESVLRTCPVVEQAAVVGVPDESRGEEVKAFVVFNGDPRAGTAVLDAFFAHADAQLAPFKVPRFVQPIAEMPLTGSQKMDKVALRGAARDPRAGSYDRAARHWLD